MNVAVMFGGKSVEHDISIISALQLINTIRKKHNCIPIYVSKDHVFYSDENLEDSKSFQNINKLKRKKNIVSFYKEENNLYIKKRFTKTRIDFVFPIFHGINGEDGSIQGFLNMYQIPYAGCDLLSAALSQSKIMMKKMLKYHRFNVLEYEELTSCFESPTIYPCILKPDLLGSSIGIKVVNDLKEYELKGRDVFLYDKKVLVEPFIENFREINCSVTKKGNIIIVSKLEEVIKNDDILSFKDKYDTTIKNSSNHIVEPILDENLIQEIKEISKEVYKTFFTTGLIRIDYMIIDNKVYVNEINTMPGSMAYYLWEDMNFVVDHCIKEGLTNYKNNLFKITSFDSNVLFKYNGCKSE